MNLHSFVARIYGKDIFDELRTAVRLLRDALESAPSMYLDLQKCHVDAAAQYGIYSAPQILSAMRHKSPSDGERRALTSTLIKETRSFRLTGGTSGRTNSCRLGRPILKHRARYSGCEMLSNESTVKQSTFCQLVPIRDLRLKICLCSDCDSRSAATRHLAIISVNSRQWNFWKLSIRVAI